MFPNPLRPFRNPHRDGGISRFGMVAGAVLIIFGAGMIADAIAGPVRVRLEGHPVFVFNAIPQPSGWGKDLVYQAPLSGSESRTLGGLGGIPLVDVWNGDRGIAVFDTSVSQQPLTVRLVYDSHGVTIEASGAPAIEILEHQGDYFDAVRAFALKMKDKGISVQPAPPWAFEANWETYGFEENYDREIIINLLPVLKNLGIRTITIDSGWYGHGRGDNFEFATGDFRVNPQIIGSEKDWIELIRRLHQEGFRVRLWWSPGVAEKSSRLWKTHPDWFAGDVVSSTGDTADVYLKPGRADVRDWNRALVRRFAGYGVDGFKQDDIYHMLSTRSADRANYANLINSNLATARAINPDFAINSCNCGLAQNFYLLPGQNQLITSDPVGSRQFRHRAKYLHALNVNGAAILGDHIELTRGDIDPSDMDEPGFYDGVDFTSVVPLGMVLQTRLRKDPGKHYQRWFDIYRKYRFYRMQWVNLPLRAGRPESYLLRDGNTLYFTFFADRDRGPFTGNVTLGHLRDGAHYRISRLPDETVIATFTADGPAWSLPVSFRHSLVLRVAPLE